MFKTNMLPSPTQNILSKLNVCTRKFNIFKYFTRLINEFKVLLNTDSNQNIVYLYDDVLGIFIHFRTIFS